MDKGYKSASVAQAVLGGKLICDPYPFLGADRGLWVSLLGEASKKGIRLYATLIKLRAIGAQLTKHNDKYYLEPIIRNDAEKWGFPSKAEWEKEKQALMPYVDTLKAMLTDLKE